MRCPPAGLPAAGAQVQPGPQAARVRVFELGRVFRTDASGARQRDHGGRLRPADERRRRWPGVRPSSSNGAHRARAVDFFDVKGDVEALLAPRVPTFVAAEHPAMHPGRCAARAAGRPRRSASSASCTRAGARATSCRPGRGSGAVRAGPAGLLARRYRPSAAGGAPPGRSRATSRWWSARRSTHDAVIGSLPRLGRAGPAAARHGCSTSTAPEGVGRRGLPADERAWRSASNCSSDEAPLTDERSTRAVKAALTAARQSRSARACVAMRESPCRQTSTHDEERVRAVNAHADQGPAVRAPVRADRPEQARVQGHGRRLLRVDRPALVERGEDVKLSGFGNFQAAHARRRARGAIRAPARWSRSTHAAW